MKTKWYKPLFTLLTLLLCMSVLYMPALAEEDDQETETQQEDVEQPDETEYEAPPEYTGQPEDTDDETDIEAEAESEAEGAVAVNAETGEEIAIGPEGTPIIISDSIPEVIELRPFTPPGSGTVVDNATDSDGKEFFIIKTVDDDIFYLIIDRQRNSQNVYFLNAVTELDLLALAQQHEREIPAGSGIILPSGKPGDERLGTEEPPDPEEPPAPSSSTGTYITLGIAFLGAGCAAYYFKIVKGKKNTTGEMDDDYGDDDEGLDEYGYDDDTEGGGDDDYETEEGERE